jgi:hypothetical protein
MQKLALRFAVCLAALGAAGTAGAESPTGIWIGNSGTVAVEVTKCGAKLCARMVRLRDEADERSCEAAKPASKGFFDGGWIFGTGKDAETDDNLTAFDMDKLKFLADVGSKLFTEPVTWQRAATDVKKCDEPVLKALPKAAAPKVSPKAHAAVAPKVAPSPVLLRKKAPAPVAEAPAKEKPVKVAKPRAIAKPSPTVSQQPSSAAGKERVAGSTDCKKYSSQIGKVIPVPCA